MKPVTSNAVYDKIESLIPSNENIFGTNSGGGFYTATHTLEIVTWNFSDGNLRIRWGSSSSPNIKFDINCPSGLTYTTPGFIIKKGESLYADGTAS